MGPWSERNPSQSDPAQSTTRPIGNNVGTPGELGGVIHRPPSELISVHWKGGNSEILSMTFCELSNMGYTLI